MMTPDQKKLALEYVANEADVSTSTQLLRAAMAELATQPTEITNKLRDETFRRRVGYAIPMSEPFMREVLNAVASQLERER